MNVQFNLRNLLSVAVFVTCLALLNACQDRTALLVKDSTPSIPLERTGIDGEYDPSGLAKRVVNALAEDSILSDISTVYVAQNNSKIIVKGTISNQTFLDRLVIVAQQVQGVSEVDISQVEFR